VPLSLFLLVFALPFHQENDPVLFLNFYEMGIVSLGTFIGSFLIDSYIIFFGNASVLNKFGMFCYRCALYGTIGGSAGNILERQLLHNSLDSLGLQWQPTGFTNFPRILTGQPVFMDYDQYWQYVLIRKYLPHISPQDYSTKYNNIVSQIDSTKTNQILINNWETVSANATSQELGRIRLGQGYFSSAVTRR